MPEEPMIQDISKTAAAMKTLQNSSRALTKDLDTMQKRMDTLNKTRVALKLDADQAGRELEEAETRLGGANDEISRMIMQSKRLTFEEAQQNLAQVSQEIDDIQRQMLETGKTISKTENTASAGARSLLIGFASSGLNNMASSLVLNFANTRVSSAFGSETGTIFSSTLSSAASGIAAGAMLGDVGGIPGIAIGAAAGGILGAASGSLAVQEDRDEAFKVYYKGLYETVSARTDAGLASGSAIAAEREEARGLADGPTYKAMVESLESRMADIGAEGGIAYNDRRKEGLAANQTAYGGTLGNALEDLNRIIGETKAISENLADQFQREALSALVLGEQTTVFQPKDEVTLEELRVQFQEASTAYENGSQEAGLQLEALKEQAEALATAAYESSDWYQTMQDTEIDQIDAIRENTKGLAAATNAYRLGAAFTKGMADTALPPASTTAMVAGLPVGPSLAGQGTVLTAVADDDDGSMKKSGRSNSGVTVGGISVSLEDALPWVRQGPADQSVIDAFNNQYATGLDYVPYDNFPALLHQGERVQTAAEARSERPAAAVTITGNSFTIREEADISRVASELLAQMELAGMRG